ncbi:MAG: type I restriction-modification system subunit M [Pyrinomonadaceae bacterium]
MAIKKSELYSSLWASCDELRGGMDASQYKDYVLSLLFIKYVSDKYAGVPFSPITIPSGASFEAMVALKGNPEIGDKINKEIIAPLADANQQLSQADFPDFNDATKLGDGKERQEKLTNLIAIFEDKALDFSKNRADGDDILGDAYEYLMRHFATESGKSKGQFYTPAEVSRVMAKIIGIRSANVTNDTTVYDPTCGSASLLLKVADEARAKVTLYGQEKDATTSGLARMNMILHNNPTALIAQGNTLTDPKFRDGETIKTFNYAVANPPFSDKRWSTGIDPLHDPFDRFQSFGTPPAKQGDYAYLLHIIRSLKSNGKGACILPHGVLFRGHAEADIRRNLVRKGYLKGIIGLPQNLFYGTGIPACIVVVDKEDAHARKGIFMIDASKEFAKDGPKNRLREQDVHRIVDVFDKRLDIPGYSRMVPAEEIEKNEYNLNLPRYVDSLKAEDIQDIDGHLRGGIPIRDIDALEKYWIVCPQLRTFLFKENRTGYVDLVVEKADIKSSIYDHSEFGEFIDLMNEHFSQWKERVSQRMKALEPGFHPKELIVELSEDLLGHYLNKPLIDAYDVYQHLMDYWAETMQDDCYLIDADGWKAETYRILETNKRGKEIDKGWACDLVPQQLIVSRFFAAEQQALREKETELENLTTKLAELEDEQGGDEGILSTVNSRTDALIARQEATIGLLESTDHDAFQKYAQAVAEQEQCRNKLHQLEDDRRIQALENAKGKITHAAVNARLQEMVDVNERALLESYKTTLATAKSANEMAQESLKSGAEAVQTRYFIEPEHEDFTELGVLNEYLELTDQITALKKAVKEADAKLDALAYAIYPILTEVEIKSLVVDDKWLAEIDRRIHAEMDRISHALMSRVKELADRYETPLPRITEHVDELAANVNQHLKRMGFAWN